MGSELATGTHVVVSKLGDFWVNAERADNITRRKALTPEASVEIDGNIVSCYAIEGIVTAAQYHVIQIKRRGGWQCKYNKWHERNQSCAHHMLGAY